MLLSSVLFVLFLAGCWLYCLAEAASTPPEEYRGLRKTTWIAIIVTTFVFGAIAWLIARRSWRTRSRPTDRAALATLALHGADDFTWYTQWTATDDAIARHPAGRSRKPRATVAKGPDDDPDFLRLLDQHIRGT